MKDATLFMKEGGADKVYRAWIEAVGNAYLVRTAWGRRDGNRQLADKSKPVSLTEAEKVHGKLVKEKMAKGYQIEPKKGEPLPLVRPASSEKFIPPMLLEPVDIDAMGSFIQLDGWYAQMKQDGVRCQLHIRRSTVTAISRTGKPLAISLDVEVAGKELLKKASLSYLVLDGELVEGIFIAFDILHVDTESTMGISLENRLEMIECFVFPKSPASAIRLTSTARTTDEKRTMLDVLKTMGAEGIVFKSKNERYIPGGRTIEAAIKVKFVTTASVQVLSHNAKRSVNMILRDGTAVGSVTIPPNRSIPAVGAVVEVRYLYAMRGGSLVQPVYLGVRADVDADHPATLQYKGEKRGAA